MTWYVRHCGNIISEGHITKESAEEWVERNVQNYGEEYRDEYTIHEANYGG